MFSRVGDLFASVPSIVVVACSSLMRTTIKSAIRPCPVEAAHGAHSPLSIRVERACHFPVPELRVSLNLEGKSVKSFIETIIHDASNMMSAPQMRAARALLGMDQRKLAKISGLSLPTIQRMEASGAVIRGNVDSLVKLVSALDAAGIELIGEGGISQGGGRGVRLKAIGAAPGHRSRSKVRSRERA